MYKIIKPGIFITFVYSNFEFILLLDFHITKKYSDYPVSVAILKEINIKTNIGPLNISVLMSLIVCIYGSGGGVSRQGVTKIVLIYYLCN